jgi:hypothetical protein
VACASHTETIAKRHMNLRFFFFFSSLFINLFFIIVHLALYKDFISYVHVAYGLESLVRLILINNSSEPQIGEVFLLESSNRPSVLDGKGYHGMHTHTIGTGETAAHQRCVLGIESSM